MEQSRLGRDTGRVLVALKTLEEAGVEVWSYQTRQQITLGSEAGEVNATVMGLVDTLHKRQASTRTRETLHPKAQRGEVAGSKVYGYTNERASKGAPAFRVIKEDEANVVRRVFTLAATMGNREIARQVGRPTTTIANMLRNTIYKGTEFYGRTRVVYKGGTKKKIATSESEWIAVKVPAIITQAQWDAAHKEMAVRSKKHPGRDERGRLHGSEPQGLPHFDSQHLLSSFLRCGSCGGGMSLQVNAPKGSKKAWRGWVCTRYSKQGGSRLEGCRGSVPYDALTQAVMNALDRDTMKEKITDYWKALFEVPADDNREDARKSRTVELTQAEKLVQNRLQAMDLGGDMPVLVARWKEASERVEALRATLSTQQAISDRYEELDPEVLADELRLTDAAHIQGNRQVLHALGVQITVDSKLKEAVIMGTLDKVVSSRLGYASCTVPVGGPWISLWASTRTPRNFAH
jgi:hypothetical protein